MAEEQKKTSKGAGGSVVVESLEAAVVVGATSKPASSSDGESSELEADDKLGVETGVPDDSLKPESEGVGEVQANQPSGSSFFRERFGRNGGLSAKRVLLIFLVVLVLGGLLAGGVYYYQSRTKGPLVIGDLSGQEQVVSSPTPTPVSEETDLSGYSVQILNGSGVVGEAGVVQGLLEREGFEDLDVGNASSYDYSQTEVQVKEGVPEGVFEAIVSALEDYAVVKVHEVLDDDFDYDVVVVVGAR